VIRRKEHILSMHDLDAALVIRPQIQLNHAHAALQSRNNRTVVVVATELIARQIQVMTHEYQVMHT
jgi:hypothetical protein